MAERLNPRLLTHLLTDLLGEDAPRWTWIGPGLSGKVGKPFGRLVGLVGVRGDREGFCAGLQARLVGSLTLFCGDRAIAEELAQEALVRALERWDRLVEMTSPEGWVYRTGFNLARSWARRRHAEQNATARLARWGRPPELPDTAMALAVREAVGALPPRQRAAIIGRFYVGLSVEDTATVLGCAPGTVKALVAKAMAKLRIAGLIEDREVFHAAPW